MVGSSSTHNLHIAVTTSGMDVVGTTVKNIATSTTAATKGVNALGNSFGTAQSGALRFSSGINKVSQETSKTTGVTNQFGKAVDQAGNKTGGLAAKFQGNKGAIFAFVGMASAGMEAVGMFGMYQSAAEKLSQAQDVVNRLEAVGAQNTNEYKDAVADVAEAQRGYNFILRNVAMSFGDLVPFTLLAINAIVKMKETVAGSKTALDAASQAATGLGNSAKTAASGGLNPMYNTAGQLTGGMTSLGTGFRNTTTATDELFTATGKTAKGLDTVGQSAVKTGSSIGSKGSGLVAGVSALDLAMSKSQSTGTKFSTFFRDLGAKIGTLPSIFTSFGSSIKSTFASIGTAIASIGSTVVSFFTNFGANMGKLPGLLSAAGAAVKAFSATMLAAFLSNPITAAIALISAAVLALITDFGGFRTALNGVGVAIGNAIPAMKGMLQAFGDIANGAMDAAAKMLGVETASDNLGKKTEESAQKIKNTISVTLEVSKAFDTARTGIDNLTYGVGRLSDSIPSIDSWHTAVLNSLTTVQKSSPEAKAALEELKQVVIASRKPGVDLAVVKQQLAAAIMKLQGVVVGEAVEQTKTIKIHKDSAASSSLLQNATLGLSNELVALATSWQIASAQGKDMTGGISENVKLVQEYVASIGETIPAVDDMNAVERVLYQTLIDNAGALEEFGGIMAYNVDGTLNYAKTIDNVTASHQKMALQSSKDWSVITANMDKGVAGIQFVVSMIEFETAKNKERGAALQKIFDEEIAKRNQVSQSLSDMIDKAVKGGDTVTDAENKAAEATAKATEELNKKIASLNLENDVIGLSEQGKKNLVKITEDEAKTTNDSVLSLQKLAVARGLDKNAIEQQTSKLVDFIATHNLEAASIDEINARIGQLIGARQEEAKATNLETQAQNALVQMMGKVPPVLDMTGKGLASLVGLYDDTTNATGIAADSVGLWYAELEKSEAVNEATRQKLIELAATLKIDVPDAIKNGSLEAFKDFIAGAKGLGDSAEENSERAKQAFNDLANDAASTLEDLIKEDVIKGDIDDVIEKLEEAGSSIDTLSAKQAIIKVMADTVDFEDKFSSLKEIMATTMGEAEMLAKGGGQKVIDAFTSSIMDHMGSEAQPIVDSVNAIWAQVQATAPAGATGATLLQMFNEALNQPSLLQATGTGLGTATTAGLETGLAGMPGVAEGMIGGTLEQFLAGEARFNESGELIAQSSVEGFQSGAHIFPTAGKKAMYDLLKTYDPAGAEAYAKANEIATETESGYNSGAGGIMTAGQKAMYDLLAPYGKAAQDAYVKSLDIADKTKAGVDTIPGKTTTALAPVPGIFSQAFVNASSLSGTQLAGIVTTVQAAMSNMSTSIATYSNSMLVNFTTAINGMQVILLPLGQNIVLLQQVFSNFSTSVAAYAASMTANMGIFFTTMGQAFPLLDTIIVTHQGTWSTFSTSIATYAASMTTNIGSWGTAAITALSNVSKNVIVTQGVFSTMSTSIKTYTSSMTTNIANFAKSATTSFDTAGKGAFGFQGKSSTLSTTVATHMRSMTTNVGNFASAAVKAFNSVGSAADANAKKVAALRKEIDALKSKEITITVNYKVNKPKGMQHGGAFIASKATSIDGVNIAEHNKPELVSVLPLTNPNQNSDQTIDIPMPNIKSPQIKMPTQQMMNGGSGQPIVVNGNLFVEVQLNDGSTIAKAVKPYLLEGYSGISSS